jgi:tripartite ATP-independent transporter DctM subunit
VFIVFLVVVGGILEGYFTPTEAGAVGTFALLVLAGLKRDMGVNKFFVSIKESLPTAVMIMMLLCGSNILGHFVTATNIPQIAADWIVSLPLNRNLVLILICLTYELGGSFIDDFAFMILATPIFFPAVMKLGFNPLWFGIIISVVIMIGMIIPPVAMCVFVVKNITKVPIGTIYKGAAPFIIALLLAGCLLFIFPQLALWLPSVFFK